ncbi:MAG: DUF4175 domain-containing protein [Acidobacteriales bacterium]|nr:DUF4175 domain-containing protein [Terriglobales bacterium]
MQALAALHALWVLLIVPVCALAIGYLLPPWLRWVGIAATSAVAVALAVLTVSEALSWLPSVAPSVRKYFLHRILFALATLP